MVKLFNIRLSKPCNSEFFKNFCILFSTQFIIFKWVARISYLKLSILRVYDSILLHSILHLFYIITLSTVVTNGKYLSFPLLCTFRISNASNLTSSLVLYSKSKNFVAPRSSRTRKPTGI